ncbi:Asp-tRNA(Asn)/Glu-tRNA(Gln) amidotransferase subunit GatA [Patescibacteria group bacterium]
MDKLNHLTIEETLEGLREGDFTSVDVTKACLEAIKTLDEKVKAFVTVVEESALKEASEADKIISKKGEKAWHKQPLLGVPYASKDNYSTQGIKTTASSNVLKDYVPPFNSTVISRLKDAGAVLLGKTNMDAFAHGSTTETSDFFNTKNPWNLDRSPGGSSGGSAAAVAANMCIFATGSETAGSIRGPASWCGVTGLKPTYGRVSRYGVVAMASSTDSPGPITKTSLDSALVLSVIAGKDQNDATTSEEKVIDYLSEAKNYSLKGVKIGKPKSYFEIDLEPKVKQKVEESLKIFEKLGAEIVEIDLIDPKYSIGVYTILQRSEVSSNLARLDGIRYGDARTEFGFEAKKRMMLGAYALSSGYYDAYYSKAQKVRTLLIEDLNEAFKKVDLIIGPTMPSVAMELGESEKSAMFGELMDVLNEQSSIAGICGVSIPCGTADNLPVGVMLMGKMFEEDKILGAAYQFQKETEFHKEIHKLKI